MPAKRVRFVYTGGPKEGNEVTVGPDKVQQLLDAGHPLRVLEGAEHLDRYEPPHDGDEGGWPPGYSYDQSGSWYTILDPEGGEVAKKQGEDAAQKAAWEHHGGEG